MQTNLDNFSYCGSITEQSYNSNNDYSSTSNYSLQDLHIYYIDQFNQSNLNTNSMCVSSSTEGKSYYSTYTEAYQDHNNISTYDHYNLIQCENFKDETELNRILLEENVKKGFSHFIIEIMLNFSKQFS